MAKKPALTPAEIKAQKSGLVALLKQQKADLQPMLKQPRPLTRLWPLPRRKLTRL